MDSKSEYYAVIFTSKMTDVTKGYEAMSKEMESLAKQQKGYLGMDSARNEIGITVSYWDSLEAIKNWKGNLQHETAQKKGKQKWYSQYHVRICKVEREYSFSK
ncbi:MAG: antibiotic biosynthesis monooxygenase [Flavobacteriaceae bacterium]|nr:antibiotic biosynthesis monooxygenase [Flavobacteriaceae bacterium]